MHTDLGLESSMYSGAEAGRGSRTGVDEGR